MASRGRAPVISGASLARPVCDATSRSARRSINSFFVVNRGAPVLGNKYLSRYLEAIHGEMIFDVGRGSGPIVDTVVAIRRRLQHPS